MESRHEGSVKSGGFIGWVPRFICFRSAADLPRVSIAALRAEAFLVTPQLRSWRVVHD